MNSTVNYPESRGKPMRRLFQSSGIAILAVLLFFSVRAGTGDEHPCTSPTVTATKAATPTNAATPTHAAPRTPTSMPCIVVLELEGKNTLSLIETNPNLRIPLTFQERCRQKPVPLTFDVVLLRTTSGEWKKAVIQDSAGQPPPSTLSAGGRTTLFLTADLPSMATYQALIQPPVTTRATRPSFPPFSVVVNRTKVPLPVEIATASSITQTTPWCRSKIALDLVIDLLAKEGPITVAPPLLLRRSLRRKPDDSSVSTPATFTFETTPSAIVLDKTGATKTLTGAKLIGLVSPGRYDATLRFGAPGYQPIDMTVAVYLREPWGYALIFIVLGVLVSALLFYHASVIRPQYQVGIRVAALNAELAAVRRRIEPGDAEAQKLVDKVDTAMAARWTKLQERGLPISTQFDVYEEVVPALSQWLVIHQSIDRLADRKVKTDLHDEMTTIAGVLAATPPDVKRIEEARTSLLSLNEKIRLAVLGEVKATLDQVRSKTAELIFRNGEHVGTLVDGLFAGVSWHDVSRPDSGAAFKKKKRTLDCVVSLVVVLVTGILGVQTLWMDNPTWGGWPSFVAAFLWGFGSDLLAKVSITALWKQI